ncbi:uncharacterized protein TM35_000511330 [Trypanosoma theileri]|uniref:Mucin TcMUCII n=1 Tax=Trypanosoma theileri TaxID=67003 RepID=A0A1X0NGZ6_9TRYP|nr:uncharacterized protein TM35_000511330 [Trypanosoma theileri]ORC84032.1 hypothetical protein TM35_000511330 [Trypanosoma theileri]
MVVMRYLIILLPLAHCFACSIVCADTTAVLKEDGAKAKAEEDHVHSDGGPCSDDATSCPPGSPLKPASPPTPALSGQPQPPHGPVPPVPQGEPGLAENRVSTASSSPVLGNPGQAAGTLRGQDAKNGVDHREDENSVDGGTKEGLVATGQKDKSHDESEEENKELKDAHKQEQGPSIGDRPSAEEPVSQTDARGTTQSTGTSTDGSHSEEPPAPPEQKNTGEASSGSSTAENTVGSDAANNVSNVASAESESTRNQNEEGAGGTETTTTTTTTTTTLPPELSNNKKGDADSSSSISSSVWVHVPLLIVVTLAYILVC